MVKADTSDWIVRADFYIYFFVRWHWTGWRKAQDHWSIHTHTHTWKKYVDMNERNKCEKKCTPKRMSNSIQRNSSEWKKIHHHQSNWYTFIHIFRQYVNNSDEVRSCTAFGRQNDSLESISSIVCISRSIQTMIFIRKKNGTIAKSGDFQHLSDGIDSQD